MDNEDFSSFSVGLQLSMLGLDLEVEEVEDDTQTVLVVADLEMIDGMWLMVDGCFEQEAKSWCSKVSRSDFVVYV